MKIQKHQAVVIQGPMKDFPLHVADFYSQFNNLVWSTWDDENEETVNKVKQLGVNVILNKKPKFCGDRNVNYQFASTLSGIEYFKNTDKNITEVIKIRSDLIVYGLERLLNRITGSDISFMYKYNKHDCSFRPVYYLDYTHVGMDFPADFIVHGNIDTMYNVFNFQMEYLSEIPPEAFILRNYLMYRRFENNFDFEYLSKIGVTFFAKWADVDNYYSLSTKTRTDLFKYPPVWGCSLLY